MPCRKLALQRYQQGVALLFALIAVLLVVALATRLGRDYLLLQRTIANQNEQSQAHAYLLGAETVAQQILLADALTGQTTDSHLEAWAQPRQLPLANAMLNACVLDLQSKLNLNDLSAPAAEGLSVMQKRFIRLLQVLPKKADGTGLVSNDEQALQLANAVFDWVDADSESRYPGGAEAAQYAQYPQPYRPANQPFVSTSELRLLMGWDADLVSALTPFVAVWGNGNINFNTLDSQLNNAQRATFNLGENAELAPVMLRTLNNADSLLPSNSEAATSLASVRSSLGGVVNTLAFFREPPLNAQQWEIDGVAVASDYFQLNAEVHMNNHRHVLQSVLQRSIDATGQNVIVVKSRSYLQGELAGELDCATPLP